MANPRNPLLWLKKTRALTWAGVADLLDISQDYAKSLGTERITSVSIAMALQWEERTDGAVKAEAVLRWSLARARGGREVGDTGAGAI